MPSEDALDRLVQHLAGAASKREAGGSSSRLLTLEGIRPCFLRFSLRRILEIAVVLLAYMAGGPA
jgi:hypothetical protein